MVLFGIRVIGLTAIAASAQAEVISEYSANFDDGFFLESVPLSTLDEPLVSTINATLQEGAPRHLSTSKKSPAPHRVMFERVCLSGMIPTGATCGHINPSRAIVQEVDVKQIVREVTCPEGTVLEGGRCHGIIKVPPQYVCPPSSIHRNGECLTFAKPRCECPEGFHRDSHHRMQCKRCVIEPGQLVCRNGSSLDPSTGNTCVQYVPVADTCPPGFHQRKGAEMPQCCEAFCPPHVQCPPGMDLNYRTKQCSAVERFPAAIVCPDGALLDPRSKQCIVTVNPPPFCPRPFVFHQPTSECMQVVPKQPAPCPPEFRLLHGNCELCRKTEAARSCPEGAILDVDQRTCVREIPVPPCCPLGFHSTHDLEEVCEKVVPKVPICPPGSEMIGMGPAVRCKRTVNLDMKVCCPPGFEFVGQNNQCRRLEEIMPEMNCEGECYRVSFSRLAYACPPGMLFVNDAPKRRPSCAPEYAEVPLACTEKFPARCLQDKADSTQLKSAAVAGKKISIRLLHRNDCFSLVSECPQMNLVPARPYCPDGGEIEGDKCRTKVPIPPQIRCPVGVLDREIGKCIKETILPAKAECPPGSSRAADGSPQCFSSDVRAPEFVCPEEAHLNRGGVCVIETSPVPQPPRTMRVPATFQCPSGQQLFGDLCVDTVRLPVPLECPPGTQPSGLLDLPRLHRHHHREGVCYRTSPMVVPSPVEKRVRPSFVCPEGSRRCGETMCEIHRTLPADEVCPPNTQPISRGMQETTCVSVTEPIVHPPRPVFSAAINVCPPNFKVVSDRCVTDEVVELMFICPPGFELDASNECIKRDLPQEICPRGSTLTPEGCCRPIVLPPSIKVVEGCTHNVLPADCADCARPVESVCHTEPSVLPKM